MSCPLVVYVQPLNHLNGCGHPSERATQYTRACPNPKMYSYRRLRVIDQRNMFFLRTKTVCWWAGTFHKLLEQTTSVISRIRCRCTRRTHDLKLGLTRKWKGHLEICPSHIVWHSQRYEHLKKRRFRPHAGSLQHELCFLCQSSE